VNNACVFQIAPNEESSAHRPPRYFSSSHLQQNGLLSHHQDIDSPLHIAAQRKINCYRQQYADNQNISFLPAILSTSTRMHGEFGVFFFYPSHPHLPADAYF